MDAAALFDWLVDGAPGAPTSVEVVQKMSESLIASGVPIDRVGAFVRTLHPTVLGRAFFWSPDRPVRVFELSEAFQRTDDYQKSPVADVSRTGKMVRRRIADGVGPEDYAVYRELAAAAVTDYVALPLLFTNGQVHTMTFATKSADGFSNEHIATFERLLRPLARLAEILALRRIAANVLDTYVGRDAGARVLAGNIRRGDVEMIRAVIWFSDLRGFTELSAKLEPRVVVQNLNEVFDLQVQAIERHGGEVLKFVGDGLLAIFAYESDAELSGKVAASFSAADEAFAALDARNACAQHPMRLGLALHAGDVAYGNIGGASRLDFTAIGAAVNTAARLEGVASKAGRALVVSELLSKHVTRPLEEVGAFELKGVPGTQRVFAPK